MTDVSAGFRPPCWCPSRWAPAWRLHTNLYKFGENVSPHIFRKKNSCVLNLGESLCISTFFPFPDSRLNLLKGFYFLFWSMWNGVTLKTSNSQENVAGAFHSTKISKSLKRGQMAQKSTYEVFQKIRELLNFRKANHWTKDFENKIKWNGNSR